MPTTYEQDVNAKYDKLKPAKEAPKEKPAVLGKNQIGEDISVGDEIGMEWKGKVEPKGKAISIKKEGNNGIFVVTDRINGAGFNESFAISHARKVIAPVVEAPGAKPVKQTRPEIKTARDAAKDHLRAYVLRGDSLKSLIDGQGAQLSNEYHVHTGGYHEGKKMKPDDIFVTELNGKPIFEKFKLKELYDEILAEKSAEKPATIEESPEQVTDKEIKFLKGSHFINKKGSTI